MDNSTLRGNGPWGRLRQAGAVPAHPPGRPDTTKAAIQSVGRAA